MNTKDAPYYLLRSKRFLPIFIVQFLGAMNDNLYKNSFIIFLTFSLAGGMGLSAKTALAGGLGIFILPFFLFSAIAGELGDRIDKERIIRWIKFAEVLILGIGATMAFYLKSVTLMYVVLFLMGTHSAFFGPLKYSILPQHLKKEELLFGNAWIEASTFVAILLGTILGGLFILKDNGVLMVSLLLISIATIGWIVSFYIPQAKSHDLKLRINPNFLKSTVEMLKYVVKRRNLFRATIGISWFWFIGASLLTIIPVFTQEILGGNPNSTTLMLTTAVIGIGIGGICCYFFLNGKLSAKLVPIAGLGMSLFIFAMVGFSEKMMGSISRFQDYPLYSRMGIIGSIMGIGLCGGFFSVPLYALIQYWSKVQHRSRNIAANNLVNALFMVGSSLLAMIVFGLGGGALALLIIIAILNIFVSIYMLWVVPKAIILNGFVVCARIVLRLLYRVEVEGKENLKKTGERTIVISNHVSLLDAVLFRAFLSDHFFYPIDTETAKRWWIKPFLSFAKTIPIDPRYPFAFKKLIKLAEEGKQIVIFPEGRITVTGSIMKIYEGPGYLAYKSDAEILPIHIEGAQYSPFSYLEGKTKLGWFPKIRITIFAPRKFESNPNKSAREVRKERTSQIYDLLTTMEVRTANKNLTLFQNLILAGKQNGMGKFIISDMDNKPLSYRRMIARSLVLGKALTKGQKENTPIGLLIPNSSAAVLAYFGLQSRHCVASMLNYSGGGTGIFKACKITKTKCIWTSKEFVKKAKLQATLELLEANGIQIKFLEDYKKSIKSYWGTFVIAMVFPEWVYKRQFNDSNKNSPDKPSTILYTSGSTGEPKGVVLSHKNLVSNYLQVNAVIDLSQQDKLLSIMPIFHAFGLMAGIIGPIFKGANIVLYPTPLHYKAIPEIVYDEEITILFATNTFLRGYLKYANPYDFRSLKYLFGGAEKIQENVRKGFAEKFGIRVLEGYGSTEASPIISLNTPIYNKTGSVGRLLPGIEYELKAVADIYEGRELWIRGDNVMLGYMLLNKPDEIEPLKDGWLNTGDIVTIDEEGFVTIVGRTKRFAKIAGEMVALNAIEELSNELWPKHMHACISKAHPVRGEILILITEKKDANLNELREFAKKRGMNPLFVPKTLKVFPRIPLLSTGKPNYIQLSKDVEA